MLCDLYSCLRIRFLLFANDVDLLASSDYDLQLSLEQFAVKSEAAGMISTSKSEMDLTWKSVECFLLGGDLEEDSGHAGGNKP